MNFSQILKWVSFLICLWMPSAYSMDLVEFIGPSFSWMSISNPNDPSLAGSPNLGWSTGLSVAVDLNEKFQVESGFYYSNRRFSITSDKFATQSISLSTVQVPLMIRYWFLSRLSFAVGGYFAQGFASVSVTQSATPTQTGYNEMGWGRQEWGVLGSIRYRTHLTDLLSFAIDERIIWGLSNLDLTGGNLQFRESQTWVGILFNI